MSVQLELEVYDLNGVAAFLNGQLEATIFMKISKCFNGGDFRKENEAFKLKKPSIVPNSLHGLFGTKRLKLY